MNFKDKFQKKGMIFSALSPDKTLTEGVELIDHPWFIGVQFIPNLNLDQCQFILYLIHL